MMVMHIITFYSYPLVPTMPPSNVSSYDTYGTRIMVKWLSIPEQHHKGILLGYKIYYQEYNETGPVWPMQSINTEGLVQRFELRDLNFTSNYSIQVGGLTSIGVGNISEPIFGMSGMYGTFYYHYKKFIIFDYFNWLYEL